MEQQQSMMMNSTQPIGNGQTSFEVPAFNNSNLNQFFNKPPIDIYEKDIGSAIDVNLNDNHPSYLCQSFNPDSETFRLLALSNSDSLKSPDRKFIFKHFKRIYETLIKQSIQSAKNMQQLEKEFISILKYINNEPIISSKAKKQIFDRVFNNQKLSSDDISTNLFTFEQREYMGLPGNIFVSMDNLKMLLSRKLYEDNQPGDSLTIPARKFFTNINGTEVVNPIFGFSPRDCEILIKLKNVGAGLMTQNDIPTLISNMILLNQYKCDNVVFHLTKNDIEALGVKKYDNPDFIYFPRVVMNTCYEMNAAFSPIPEDPSVNNPNLFNPKEFLSYARRFSNCKDIFVQIPFLGNNDQQMKVKAEGLFPYAIFINNEAFMTVKELQKRIQVHLKTITESYVKGENNNAYIAEVLRLKKNFTDSGFIMNINVNNKQTTQSLTNGLTNAILNNVDVTNAVSGATDMKTLIEMSKRNFSPSEYQQFNKIIEEKHLMSNLEKQQSGIATGDFLGHLKTGISD